jgi:hypothetical protein
VFDSNKLCRSRLKMVRPQHNELHSTRVLESLRAIHVLNQRRRSLKKTSHRFPGNMLDPIQLSPTLRGNTVPNQDAEFGPLHIRCTNSDCGRLHSRDPAH